MADPSSATSLVHPAGNWGNVEQLTTPTGYTVRWASDEPEAGQG